MLPRKLKQKYNPSYNKMAVLPQRDQTTLKRYSLNYKEEDIPPSVIGYCCLLDFWFSQKGMVPPLYIFYPN
jgi:hypothetical protein